MQYFPLGVETAAAFHGVMPAVIFRLATIIVAAVRYGTFLDP